MSTAALVYMLEAVVALSAADCTRLEAAHEKLLDSCFSAQRYLEATLNNRPFLREHVTFEYRRSELTITTQSREVLKKGFQIDSENGDLALDVSFACERLTLRDEQTFILSGAEDPERVTFKLDEQQQVLVPQRYQFNTTERFLFKKFAIALEVDYRDVILKSCDAD